MITGGQISQVLAQLATGNNRGTDFTGTGTVIYR